MSRSIAISIAVAVLCLTSYMASAIVNGTTVTPAEQQQKGLVTISVGCSGVLVVNDWVLTAGHCADQNRLSPGSLGVTFLAQAINADAVYLFGGFADEVGPDVALLHLSSPFNIGGRTTGFRNNILGGTPHDLFGKTVALYGQGRTDCVGPPAGAGTYRAADFVVNSGDYVAAVRPNNPAAPPAASNFSASEGGPFFQISRTSTGQITRPGDSGSPSFRSECRWIWPILRKLVAAHSVLDRRRLQDQVDPRCPIAASFCLSE
jgi:Trypsin